MVLTIKFKKGNKMPKLDPDDAGTASTTTAPAPLPSSTNVFGSTPTSGASNGFGTTTPATSFGSTPTSSFGASTTGFNSAPTNSFGGGASTGASAFGSSTGGFGSTGGSTFGGTSGGFGGGFSSNQIGTNVNINQGMSTGTAAADAFGNVMAAEAAAGGHEEHWMKTFWRPAMGWLYMLICFMDFCVFPMLSMFLPVIERMFGLQMGYTPWQSLTLSNGGLIHLAFGAILGVSAYGRTQEKKSGTS
jgi:hypothetical protein